MTTSSDQPWLDGTVASTVAIDRLAQQASYIANPTSSVCPPGYHQLPDGTCIWCPPKGFGAPCRAVDPQTAWKLYRDSQGRNMGTGGAQSPQPPLPGMPPPYPTPYPAPPYPPSPPPQPPPYPIPNPMPSTGGSSMLSPVAIPRITAAYPTSPGQPCLGPFAAAEKEEIAPIPGWAWSTDPEGRYWYCPPGHEPPAHTTAGVPVVQQPLYPPRGAGSSPAGPCLGPYTEEVIYRIQPISGWTWIRDDRGLFWYCPPGGLPPPQYSAAPASAAAPAQAGGGVTPTTAAAGAGASTSGGAVASTSAAASQPSSATGVQTFTVVQTPPAPYYLALQGTPASWQAHGYQLPSGWSVLETVTDTQADVTNIVNGLASKAIFSTIPGQQDLPPGVSEITSSS